MRRSQVIRLRAGRPAQERRRREVVDALLAARGLIDAGLNGSVSLEEATCEADSRLHAALRVVLDGSLD